jgi:hypothetical protein
MTYESVFGQAEMKKFFKSTFSERKIMSTKTSIKRIAAVAAVALTLGGFSAVSAHAGAVTTVTAATVATQTPARVGATASATITLSVPNAASGDSYTVGAAITSAPAGSSSFGAAPTGTGFVSLAGVASSSTLGTLHATAGVAGGLGASNYADFVYAGSVAAGTATTMAVKVLLTPDVAGTYQILVYANHSSYTAGDPSAIVTFTTAGSPTALTLASYAGSVTSKDEATGGQLFKLTMKDAAGNATVLAPNEAIKLTSTDSNTTVVGDSGVATFGSASGATGSYYVRVTGNTSVTTGTATLTAAGTGLLSSSLTTNATITETTVSYFTGGVVTCTTGTNCVAGSNFTVAGPSVGLSITASAALAATTYFVALVTDSAAKTYSGVATLAIGDTSATYASPAVSSGLTSIVKPLTAANTGTAYTFNYAAGAATTLTVQGASSVLSATGAKNTFTVLAANQWGTKLPYVAVTVAVSGRNTVATTAIGVTDANGLISYSLTDVGTTGTSDSVVFTDSAAHTATGKITYGAVTVSTVAIKGGSTTADAASGSTNYTPIATGDNGPEGSAVKFTATVKDASGNLLAGVPVTFSVDKGLIKKAAAIDYSVVYTGSDGTAVSYAFDWIAEKQTVTATAGGVAKSDYLTWQANDAASARVLSAAVSGTIITYTVKDRFGNPVKGAIINLTRTGSGLFGNGSSTQDVTTGTDGTVDATFTGTGSAVGTLAATYLQAYAPAGQYDFTAGDTYTAAVAGTTSGTGASLAPAGVYTVTSKTTADTASVDAAQAATDAANEATDAANAATDAANNAMDSADAAQQAALDAGDKADAALAAVTDLASKVADIATQISALSSLVSKIAASVAKISAKVKA